MIEFLHLNVNDINDDLIKNLPSYRKEKANRYVFDKDKKLSLAAGILLEEGLNKLLVKTEEREIAYLEQGKPYLKNRPDIHFSLSHSMEIAIAAFSDKEIGCDIEKIKTYNEIVMNRCFSMREKEYVLNSISKDEAFYRIWVLKESFLKAIGVGIAVDMSAVSFSINENKVSLDQHLDARKWKFEEKRIDDYLVSICEEV